MSAPTQADVYAQALRQIREIAEEASPDETRLQTILEIAADALADGGEA